MAGFDVERTSCLKKDGIILVFVDLFRVYPNNIGIFSAIFGLCTNALHIWWELIVHKLAIALICFNILGGLLTFILWHKSTEGFDINLIGVSIICSSKLVATWRFRHLFSSKHLSSTSSKTVPTAHIHGLTHGNIVQLRREIPATWALILHGMAHLWGIVLVITSHLIIIISQYFLTVERRDLTIVETTIGLMTTSILASILLALVGVVCRCTTAHCL